MVTVWLHYEDGAKWLEKVPTSTIKHFPEVFNVPEEFWQAYQEHTKQCRTWYNILNGLEIYHDKWS